MRVHYRLGEFISHQRAGRDNIYALKAAGADLVDDPARAEAVIVHDEPRFMARHLDGLGGAEALAGKVLVAYSVFEMDRAPGAWKDMLAPFDQVWTCTEFSRRALSGVHPQVRVVPHVVRRPRITPQDAESVRELLGMEPGPKQKLPDYWFYAVSDGINPRKNLPALLRAYGALRAEGLRVRLALKLYRAPLAEMVSGLGELPGVRVLEQELTDGQVAALHALCHCYVSPHRAEAWGLSLAEAMAFGNPVVATAHSGNTEYMDETNSLPVGFTLREVTQDEAEKTPGLSLEPGMVWAEPDQEDLAAQMRRAAKGEYDPSLAERAREVAVDYGLDPVGRIMDALLQVLAEDKAKD